MAIQTKKVAAPTMPLLYKKIKDSYGQDATILDQKYVRAPGVKGWLGIQHIEARIAIDTPVSATPELFGEVGSRRSPAHRPKPSTMAELEQLVGSKPPSIAPDQQSPPSINPSGEQQKIALEPSPVLTTTPPVSNNTPSKNVASASPKSEHTTPPLSPDRIDKLEQRFVELMTRVDNLMKIPGTTESTSQEPVGTWAKMIAKLKNRGLDVELLEPFRIDWEPELVGTSQPWKIMQRLLASQIKTFHPMETETLIPGKVIVLIGPTGVGKTTTLAKMASRIGAPGAGQQVGLLTADVYRLAAEDQLRRYAEILQTPPLEVVHCPEEVPAALNRLAHCDVVFVDTAGRSPRDKEHMEELSQYLAVLPESEIHLVMSSTEHENQIDTVLQAFQSHQPVSLIFTKLDESCHYASLINACLRSGLPLSYYTTGQRVPEDMEPVDPYQLVEVVMSEFTMQENNDQVV